MPVKIKLRKRILRSKDKSTVLSKTTPAPEYSTATKKILEHPEFTRIRDALRGGTSVPSIVKWFEQEAWLGTMSPSTFTQYLYKFKVERADLVTGTPSRTTSYDYHVGTNIPDVDEVKELDKLILIQKRRLSMEIETELNMGKLLDNTHKEINSMNELLKSRHQLTKGGDDIAEGGSVSDGTALRTLRVSEGEQDKMQELTTTLFKEIQNASKAKAAPKAKRLKARA